MIQSPLNGKRVLVVDDEADLRDAIVFDLKKRGCVTFESPNGIEALKLALASPIDIIVSDVRMPEGTGVHLLKELRKIDQKLPIILLATGFADLSETEALGMGAQGLIEKPINRKLMIDLLEKSLVLTV